MSMNETDLAQLLTCDAVMTLPGWSESRGASLEVRLAHGLGIPVFPLTRLKDVAL